MESSGADDRGAFAEPVMAVVRVRVPVEVDPHVLAAELTRAIWERSVAAELVSLPAAATSHRRGRDSGMRRYGFVAVLRGDRPRRDGKLARVAEKAVRKRLRHRFGSTATAQVGLPGSDTAVLAGWCSLRGTPHRP
jgi:hypothetical protein